MDSDRERDQVLRLTLAEAAAKLGTSKDAVRMRVRRGTLRSEKGANGRVYVFLNATTYGVHPESEVEGAEARLVEVLRAQVEDLRGRLDRETEANRENRRIIAGLIERVPELEAPGAGRDTGKRGSPLRDEEAREGYSPGQDRGATETAGEASERRPWWRRVFGG